MSAWNEGDLGSISGSGRSPGEGNGNPLQYSCLGNPMDRRSWQATVHGVTKESDTTERLHFTTVFQGKETATHSSIFAWEIPWTEDPGRLQSMRLQGSDRTKRLNHHHSGMKQREIWGSTSWVLVGHQGTSQEAKTKPQPPWTSEPAGSCCAL